MTKNRKDTTPILIDLHYKYSINRFEEFYGDWISYSEIEQVSYIDFKDMVFEMIGRGVKFRKFGREKRVLTIKADMTKAEYESFLRIFNKEEVDEESTNDLDKNPEGETKYLKFNFLHEFEVSNIRDLTRAESIKFKKVSADEEEEEEEEETELND
jgi:hypothetical protein